MQFPLIVIALLLLPFQGEKACGGADSRIQWSRADTIKSPDCEWTLQIVPPTQSEEDKGAYAYLHKQGEQRYLLFRLERQGVVHWEPNGKGLLLEDKQFSDHFRLRWFPLHNGGNSAARSSELDAAIQADIRHRLHPTQQISYYLPRFVRWTEDGALLSVGVMTTAGSSGPFTPHCFGYAITLSPVHISKVLSESGLKTESAASCQIWP